MRNDGVHSVFSSILMDISPQVPEQKIELVAETPATLSVLEQAAEVMCHSNAQRKLLQTIYKLGVVDGEMKANTLALKRLTV